MESLHEFKTAHRDHEPGSAGFQSADSNLADQLAGRDASAPGQFVEREASPFFLLFDAGRDLVFQGFA